MTQDTESLLQSAIAAHDQRRGDEALRLYGEVLREAPDHPVALFRLAQLKFQAGEKGESAYLMEKAVAADPHDAQLHYWLGFVLSVQGRTDEALHSLERAVALAPGELEPLLKLGELRLSTGARELALTDFQRALVMAPHMRHWRTDPSVPEGLRASIDVAMRALRQKFASFADECVSFVAEQYPGENLSRLKTGVEELCGVRDRRQPSPGRRPGLLSFPDLPERAWFEREEFDWCERVEAACAAIRAELDGLLTSRAGFKPYCTESASDTMLSASGTDFSSLAGSMAWNSFHLYKGSYRVDDNCASCPGTVSLMESLPMPRIRNQSPEIFFSCLRPGAHIIPHHGLMNVRLTVHLPLIVPHGCRIRACNETRHWREGELLFFDDSYEHEALNEGNSDRVVLILEAWNPDLSEAERAGVSHIFKLRRDWLDRFDGQAEPPRGQS